MLTLVTEKMTEPHHIGQRQMRRVEVAAHICECSHAHTIIRGAQRRKRVVSTWSVKGPETKGQCM